MLKLRRFRWFSVLGLGVMAGLLIGLGAAPFLRTTAPQSVEAKFEEMKLKASTAMGSETFAVATGMVDEEGEGVFFLDYITGDLNCFVLNPRVGKFTGWFTVNVTEALSPAKGKKPSYVISTGSWNPKGFSSNVRPAQSVVYVADANSGQFAAYTFPWVRGTSSVLAKQANKLVLLDVGKARAVELRE